MEKHEENRMQYRRQPKQIMRIQSNYIQGRTRARLFTDKAVAKRVLQELLH